MISEYGRMRIAERAYRAKPCRGFIWPCRRSTRTKLVSGCYRPGYLMGKRSGSAMDINGRAV